MGLITGLTTKEVITVGGGVELGGRLPGAGTPLSVVVVGSLLSESVVGSLLSVSVVGSLLGVVVVGSLPGVAGADS